MNKKEEIVKFVINGYKNIQSELVTDEIHSFVLKNKKDNFKTSPQNDFKFHRWAGSLKVLKPLHIMFFQV